MRLVSKQRSLLLTTLSLFLGVHLVMAGDLANWGTVNVASPVDIEYNDEVNGIYVKIFKNKEEQTTELPRNTKGLKFEHQFLAIRTIEGFG